MGDGASRFPLNGENRKMRKNRIKAGFFALVTTFFLTGAIGFQANLVHAEEEVVSTDPEERAGEIHRVASSDTIYEQAELKALYYQNVKIIDLLKEIRDLLKERSLKGEYTQNQ